jgi:3-deoxy-7-phosphoheptulonate synthase
MDEPEWCLTVADLPFQAPDRGYRTISRSDAPGDEPFRTSLVRVGRAVFGGPRPVVIAGPCAVENAAQTLAIARAVRSCGADMLRGGAYKPRTSPHDFQGLGAEGLKILADARAETGLPIVTEVIDVRLVDQVARYADMLQIGSRSMQNFPLLVEAGRCGKPVLLKRSMAATLVEWLCAAEYIACEGNLQIVFCERGIRSPQSGEYSRFSLDLNVIPALREATSLPVIVDPSHATGRASMVSPAARAAIAAGAHGVIVEVIAEDTLRETVRCDAAQAIRPSVLREIVLDAQRLAREPVGAAAVT